MNLEAVVSEESASTIIELKDPPACPAGIRTSKVKVPVVPWTTTIAPGLVLVQPVGKPEIVISKLVSALLLLVKLMVIVAI
jgi:hypothetical protein